MNKSYYTAINNRNYHNLYRCGNYLYSMGEEDFNDRKLILISFDNYDYHKKNQFIYRFKPKEDFFSLIDNENLEIYRINLTYLENICYNKKVKELSKLERYLLMLLVEDKKLRKEIEGDDEILKKVNKTIEEYNSEEFNNLFHYDADAELEHIRKYEHEQGELIGEKRGFESGIQQEKTNIAKNMLKNGIAIDLISKITKLDKKYISTL